jgi:DNA-binding HxlR family transcriptional regulator
MKRTSLSRWPCSIAKTMDIFGDRWTTLVLREAFYGFGKFDELQSELGIARNTLADRLRRLTSEGLLEKKLYDTNPRRYEYVLTEKGRDFWPVMLAMSAWGDRWLVGDEGHPVTIHHDTCGHDTHAEVVCAVCGEPLRAGETSMRMGPGYPEALKDWPTAPQRFTAPEALVDETRVCVRRRKND